MVAFSLFLERLGSAALICGNVAGHRTCAAAGAAVCRAGGLLWQRTLPQQLSSAVEQPQPQPCSSSWAWHPSLTTVQACQHALELTYEIDARLQSLSLTQLLVSNSNQHCSHPPSSAATCSNAMHTGRSPHTFCAAPSEDITPPSRQAAAHQSMEAAAPWLLAADQAAEAGLRQRGSQRANGVLTGAKPVCRLACPATMSMRPPGMIFCNQSACTECDTAPSMRRVCSAQQMLD